MVALQGGSNDSFRNSTDHRLVSEDPELKSRYRAYRSRQANALVSILPQEAIRPLYSRARIWAGEIGIPLGKDPLATLLLYLQEIIPLPPFDVWLADRTTHLDAHLEEEFASEPAHRRVSSPVTVESRGLEMAGRRWRASLSLFRRDDAWRGFISFRRAGDDTGVRTADIFREEDPEEIRDRFRGFHSGTLQAFLRSVLF
jgi:hypothetical protein